MPEVPPDPRALINERIHHFKKQTQKLNLEVIEAEQELERAKEAVRLSRMKAAIPARAPASAARPPAPTPRAVIAIRPFDGGVGFAVRMEGRDLWFDSEIHAMNYIQDLYPHCDIAVLNADGTVRHQYGPSGPRPG
jgi:hypothetical protein